MRIVVLCSSVYSETACAVSVHLSNMGYIPAGALSLATLNSRTLLRKLGQWGPRQVADYARSKVFAQRKRQASWNNQVHNPHLQHLLDGAGKAFRSMRDVAKFYEFPVAVCHDQNAPGSISQVKAWSPDIIVFTGGNILRQPLLDVPRAGVLNVHLGLLPEVRGMSSPEWSLLKRVPVGVSIHYMDAGIDTGPILKRCEFRDPHLCGSLSDLRNRLIAFGIDKLGDVICALDHGSLISTTQTDVTPGPKHDNQFFVMHEFLRARAAECISKNPGTSRAEAIDG